MKKIISILAAMALLSACSEAPTSQTTGGEAVAQPEAKPLNVGAIGKAKGIEVTIDSVKVASQVGPNGVGIKAAAGETYVVVAYTLKNTSDEKLGFMEWPALNLIDGNGQSYSKDDLAGAMAVAMSPDAAAAVATELNPGTLTKGGTAWKVAKEGFDESTWRIVVASDPELTFALK